MLFTLSRRGKIGRSFGIKGPAVSEVIKMIEGRLEEEIKLRKEMEYLRKKDNRILKV